MGSTAVSPDAFLYGLLEQHRSKMLDLLTEQAAELANPPLTFAELLDGLSNKTPEFAARVRV